MGWMVIGFAQIETNPLTEYELTSIEDIVNRNDGLNLFVDDTKSFIEFEISGNKGLRYEVLDEIKKLLKDKKILRITCNEFVESDEGYYYNKEEEIVNDVGKRNTKRTA